MENIYTILDWVCGTLVVITFLYIIKNLDNIASTGWEEEKETKKAP